MSSPVSKPASKAKPASKVVDKTDTQKAAAKSGSKPKKAATHPPFQEMITDCITSYPQESRYGVSRQTIKKFLEERYNIVIDASSNSHISKAIKNGEAAGRFTLPKGPSGKVKLASKKNADASKENDVPTRKGSTSTTKKAVKKDVADGKKPLAPSKGTSTGKKPLAPSKGVAAAKNTAVKKTTTAKKPATSIVTKKPVSGAKKATAKKVTSTTANKAVEKAKAAAAKPKAKAVAKNAAVPTKRKAPIKT